MEAASDCVVLTVHDAVESVTGGMHWEWASVVEGAVSGCDGTRMTVLDVERGLHMECQLVFFMASNVP